MILSTGKKSEFIHGDLREKILSGEYSIGARLPVESELAQTYDCSIGTVSKAVALLVHEGLVERRPRTGTRVIANSLNTFSSSSPTTLNAFAFIYPSAQHESTWRMMKSFQKAAKDKQRRVVTLDTGTEYQREAEYISRLLEFDVCGAVISPLLSTPEDYVHVSSILMRCSIPILLIGTHLHGMNFPSVSFDSFHGSYSATRHLLERGAKRIGFLCNQAFLARNYYEGYLWALEERGMKPEPDWILRERTMHPNFENPVDEPRELGARYLKQSGKHVDAVVCTQDYLALGLIDAAKAVRKRVPQDLKVVGVDGLELSQQGDFSLTSYHFPFEAAGQKAFEVLNYLVGSPTGTVAEQRLRGQVVQGTSS